MEGLQQSVDELIAPLVPNVASLVAMANSEKGKNKEDDGLLGPPYKPPPPPPPPPVTQPPVHPRYPDHWPEQHEDDHSFLRPRMVFPSFDGTSDPLPWINRCDLYFRSHNTPDHKKVWMASLHMTDAAQLWYYRLETIQGEPDWHRFYQLVNRRFGPAITSHLWANPPSRAERARWRNTPNSSSPSLVARWSSRNASRSKFSSLASPTHYGQTWLSNLRRLLTMPFITLAPTSNGWLSNRHRSGQVVVRRFAQEASRARNQLRHRVHSWPACTQGQPQGLSLLQLAQQGQRAPRRCPDGSSRPRRWPKAVQRGCVSTA